MALVAHKALPVAVWLSPKSAQAVELKLVQDCVIKERRAGVADWVVVTVVVLAVAGLVHGPDRPLALLPPVAVGAPLEAALALAQQRERVPRRAGGGRTLRRPRPSPSR